MTTKPKDEEGIPPVSPSGRGEQGRLDAGLAIVIAAVVLSACGESSRPGPGWVEVASAEKDWPAIMQDQAGCYWLHDLSSIRPLTKTDGHQWCSTARPAESVVDAPAAGQHGMNHDPGESP